MSNRPKRNDSEWATAPIEGPGAAGVQLAQTAARYQAECLNLFSRRASAYLEFPARLSQCGSPTDLLREQMHFLTTMQQHYFEATQHLLEATLKTSAATVSEESDSQVAPESAPRSAVRERQNDSLSEQVEPQAA